MATLKSIEQKFLQRQTLYQQNLGQKIQLESMIQELENKKSEANAKRDLYAQTVELLLKVSSTARQRAQKKIEDLVTLALSAVTGEPYEFKMDLVQSAGQWSVRFFVINPEGIKLDPLTGCGGGITDICSMALRIAILEMYEPRIEGPILLDENFKFLSRNHIRTAVEFLHSLSLRTGRQILLVTHVPELAAGAKKCFEIQPLGNSSFVSENVNTNDIIDSL